MVIFPNSALEFNRVAKIYSDNKFVFKFMK